MNRLHEAFEAAAKEVSGHWLDRHCAVNQYDQAQRSADVLRRLKSLHPDARILGPDEVAVPREAVEEILYVLGRFSLLAAPQIAAPQVQGSSPIETETTSVTSEQVVRAAPPAGAAPSLVKKLDALMALVAHYEGNEWFTRAETVGEEFLKEYPAVRAEIERLLIADKFLSSRQCPDHAGKWERGRCLQCEIERLTQALDRCDDARMQAEKLAARQAEEIAEGERLLQKLYDQVDKFCAEHGEADFYIGEQKAFLSRKRGA